ncbi:MoxR-like ATPase [Asanoa hainanensis]|uniref:MoxR-like ATPase n=1 Tax=Asanoa hainanensis TaxID=560556 RepID=A0A239NZC4_9ACTN|nr:MoxR-like ATPase [Asanoa hainanensis]
MTQPQQEPLPAGHISGFAALAGRLADAVGAVVLGKQEVVRLTLTALFAQGHVLLEDVPGVGKTTLARALAATVHGQWRRIQFTPDLLPSDVSGVTIFNQATRGFEFHPGPVFANIVIADEINRASPKTQSALLEVMEERTVTVDGVRHTVPRPFLVVATQNPVEMDGTYRLPEAQLDRFLMKLSVGYPDESVEIEVLRGANLRSPDALEAVTDTATVGEMVRMAQQVHVADPLYAYAVRLAAATRAHPQVRVGVSPRGVIALTRAACAYALINGRGYVLPEDLKALLGPVFAHRILLTPDAQLRGTTPDEVLADAMRTVPVPLPGGGGAGPTPPAANGRASARVAPAAPPPAANGYATPAQPNGAAHAAAQPNGAAHHPAQPHGTAHAPAQPNGAVYYPAPHSAGHAPAQLDGATDAGSGGAARPAASAHATKAARGRLFGFGGLRPLPGS